MIRTSIKFGTAAVLGPVAGSASAGNTVSIPFDSDNFDNPLVIDNQAPGKPV